MRPVVFNGEFDSHERAVSGFKLETLTTFGAAQSPMEKLKIIADQNFGDLHRVERGAFAQVVGDDPEIEPIGD